MLLTFTFTVDPERQAVTYAGNIGLQEALNILQQIVIADAVNKAREAEKAGQTKSEDVKLEKEV